MRKDLWAVILECPFATFHNAAANHANRLGMPGPFFQEPAFRLAKWMSGADFDAVRPIDTIGKIPCPLMVIQSDDDPFLSTEDRAAVRKAVESREFLARPQHLLDIAGHPPRRGNEGKLG